MSIIKGRKYAYRHKVEEELAHEFGQNYTPEQVLDYFFGNYDTDYRPYGDLHIYKYDSDDRTVLHRLNMCWVLTVTLLIAPVRYILYGDFGWTANTKVGSWLLKITGHMEE